MKQKQNLMSALAFSIAGGVLVAWLALKIAPGLGQGLPGVTAALNSASQNPLDIQIVPKTWETLAMFLLLYVLGVGVYLTSLLNFRRGEEYGSARWGSPRVLARKYRDKKRPAQNLILTRDMAVATDREKMFRHQRNLNTLVIGGSGSQKTRSHVMPNLLQGGMSYVVLDPSGEILRAAGSYLMEQGYRVKVLNLFEPEKSQRYNPFVYLQNDDDVDRMIENFWKATTEKGAMKGDQFWEDTAKELLAALCYYLFYFAPPEEQSFPMVQFLARSMQVDEEKKEKNAVDLLFESLEQREPDHIALRHYHAYHSGAAKTLQSIQITLLSRLGKFNLESIRRLSDTAEDSLGLYDIPKEKSVLFAITPVADTSLNFFVSMLYGQLLDVIYRYGGAHGRLDVPLHLLMDEFANICLPKDFEKYLATFRKYGVSASIILQDLSQLKALYEKEWQSIVGNCDSLLYLGGNEESTCKYISELIGKQTIKTNTFGFNRGRNGGSSKNEQQLGRELLTPDEVRSLNNRYCVLLLRGEPPIMDLKFSLREHPAYSRTAFGEGLPYDPGTKEAAAGETRLRTDLAGDFDAQGRFTLIRKEAQPDGTEKEAGVVLPEIPRPASLVFIGEDGEPASPEEIAALGLPV